MKLPLLLALLALVTACNPYPKRHAALDRSFYEGRISQRQYAMEKNILSRYEAEAMARTASRNQMFASMGSGPVYVTPRYQQPPMGSYLNPVQVEVRRGY